MVNFKNVKVMEWSELKEDRKYVESFGEVIEMYYPSGNPFGDEAEFANHCLNHLIDDLKCMASYYRAQKKDLKAMEPCLFNGNGEPNKEYDKWEKVVKVVENGLDRAKRFVKMYEDKETQREYLKEYYRSWKNAKSAENKAEEKIIEKK